MPADQTAVRTPVATVTGSTQLLHFGATFIADYRTPTLDLVNALNCFERSAHPQMPFADGGYSSTRSASKTSTKGVV